MSEDQYKVHYFDMRARGETIRILLSAANLKFEDVRIARADWPKTKPLIPGGKIPYVVTPDGKGLTQSSAIARYLARENNLYPTESYPAYLTDRAMSQLDDIYAEIFKMSSLPADKKELAEKEFLANRGKVLQEGLVQYLEEDNRTYFAGDQLTVADLHFINCHEYLVQMDPNVDQQYPRLLKLVESILSSNEGVAKWLEKRPKTSF